MQCKEEKYTYNCSGCSGDFCFTHLKEHRHVLDKELDLIIADYERYKKTKSEQKRTSQSSSLIQQIDEWEEQSIATIRRTAQECRESVVKHIKVPETANDTDKKLDELTKKLKLIREDSEFNEIDLDRLRRKLSDVTHNETKPAELSIKHDSLALIYRISVLSLTPGTSRLFSLVVYIDAILGLQHRKWRIRGITVAGGNGQGHELNQLHCPLGISFDQGNHILISDYDNHRIVRWKCLAKAGTLIAGGKGQGNQMNQLDWPTDVLFDKQTHSFIIADQGNRRVIRWFDKDPEKQEVLIDDIACCGLAVDKQGLLYISDIEKNEVRRWKSGKGQGKVAVGGNGKGNKLNQLSRPSYLYVDEHQSVYISDWENHRVIKWTKDAKEGVVVAGGNGEGHGLNQLSQPQGVLVDRWGYIYVTDGGNHRIVRWCEGDKEGEIVAGGNGKGKESNQLHGPTGLAFDDEGNLYVADYGNNRIQKFDYVLE
jgi:sugar lactone lactonase YvrE